MARGQAGSTDHEYVHEVEKQLEIDLSRYVGFWLKAHQLPTSPPGDSPAFDESAYRAWAARELNQTSLLGATSFYQQADTLQSVYVPALVALRREEKPTADSDQEPYEPLLHRLGTASLLLEGGAGAGKSVLCQWVALTTALSTVPAHPIGLDEDARRYRETLPDGLHDKIPILCRLRDVAEQRSAAGGYLWANGQWGQARLERALAEWLDQDRRRPAGR